MKRGSAARIAALALLLLAIGTPARAADITAGDTTSLEPESSQPSRWSWVFDTSYLFHTIPNPFFSIAGQRGADNYKNPHDYHLYTEILGARYQFGDTGGWSFLRGNWQFDMQLTYSDIVKGPETYFEGILIGFRYNFIPEDSAWAPYMEARGGCGFTDASHVWYGQQHDFTFTYLLGLGLRYEVAPKWQVSLGVMDQHLSDFYLTNPNYGFDATGFNLSIDRYF